MTGRPPNPKPAPAEIEARILDALRAAGGSSQRADLRNAIRPRMATAEFDQALSALAARGEITGEEIEGVRLSCWGTSHPYPAMVYKLAPRGRRKPTVIPPVRFQGKRRTKPIPAGTELEERIMAALGTAAAPLSRNELRLTVDKRLSAAMLSAVLARLLATKQVETELVTREWMGRLGPIPYQVAVYSLQQGW